MNQIKDLSGFMRAVEREYNSKPNASDRIGLACLYYTRSAKIVFNEINEQDYIKQWLGEDDD